MVVRTDLMYPHYLITTHVLSQQIIPNATTPTVFFQTPVAVHFSLGLDPVPAVCPQGGLGLGNHGGAWEERGGRTAAVLWIGVAVPGNYKQR